LSGISDRILALVTAMPTLHELIAGRLTVTGVSPAMAGRIAALVEQDLHMTGHCIVKTSQLDLIVDELTRLQSTAKMLADACVRMEQQWPMPKEGR
jgi:2-phosphoglycerate kinase